MFRDRRRVVLHIALKKRTHFLGELIEFLHAWTDQYEQAHKPVTATVQVIGCPESTLMQDRLEPSREFVERQAQDVLLIEPIELLGIEDCIPTADALQGERPDQVVAREQFAVVARRPAKQGE